MAKEASSLIESDQIIFTDSGRLPISHVHRSGCRMSVFADLMKTVKSDSVNVMNVRNKHGGPIE